MLPASTGPTPGSASSWACVAVLRLIGADGASGAVVPPASAPGCSRGLPRRRPRHRSAAGCLRRSLRRRSPCSPGRAVPGRCPAAHRRPPRSRRSSGHRRAASPRRAAPPDRPRRPPRARAPPTTQPPRRRRRASRTPRASRSPEPPYSSPAWLPAQRRCLLATPGTASPLRSTTRPRRQPGEQGSRAPPLPGGQGRVPVLTTAAAWSPRRPGRRSARRAAERPPQGQPARPGRTTTPRRNARSLRPGRVAVTRPVWTTSAGAVVNRPAREPQQLRDTGVGVAALLCARLIVRGASPLHRVGDLDDSSRRAVDVVQLQA
jgi:hypothetical protein